MTLAEAAPIACTLNAAELKSCGSKLAELNCTALQSYRRSGLRLELLYAIAARPQVLEMVRAQQTCCAFLTFEVREEHGAVRVIVEAPERARDVAEAFSNHSIPRRQARDLAVARPYLQQPPPTG